MFLKNTNAMIWNTTKILPPRKMWVSHWNSIHLPDTKNKIYIWYIFFLVGTKVVVLFCAVVVVGSGVVGFCVVVGATVDVGPGAKVVVTHSLLWTKILNILMMLCFYSLFLFCLLFIIYIIVPSIIIYTVLVLCRGIG